MNCLNIHTCVRRNNSMNTWILIVVIICSTVLLISGIAALLWIFVISKIIKAWSNMVDRFDE